jgi:cytoskeleton protein RodZ
MVRNYARLLKLDPEPLLQRMAAGVEAPDPNYLASRLKQPVPFSDSGRRATTQYLILSFVMLAVVGVIAYQWYYERNAPQETALVAPATVQTPAEQPVALQPLIPSASPSTVAEPAPEKKAASPQETPSKQKPDAKSGAPRPEAKAIAAKAEAAPPEQAKPAAAVSAAGPVVPGVVHRIVVRTEGEAWIEIRDASDRTLISSLNPAGTERAIRGRPPFNLVIGNASNVRLTYNGQPVDLKPHTKVEVARFTLK